MTSTTDPAAGQPPASPVESVDRALRLLQVLAGAGPQGASLAEISGEVGLHKTTAFRTLGALRHRDFVAQDPATGRYQLGPAAVTLGDRYLREENLPGLMHGALVALCAETDELVHLGVLSGVQMIYLDKVEPQRPVRVWSAIGRRNWAVTTALGRAMLAFRGLSRPVVDGYVRAAVEDGARQDIDAAHVWEELERARSRGYAIEYQENEQGIACLAVPLLRGSAPPAGPSQVVGAVSITAPADRMGPDRMASVHEQIRRTLPPLLPAGLVLPPEL
ncbi:IclR family transcriptional regulator [Kineosporia sp. J2-2]|uniref:IclR family transcriptional regulator n=1 Tax=Kineosporia corallincola TaxID=2835133 RepID=A0ABS5TRW6_9ACTN|nr:IclR family transcriptional regulator [Kineosporia corallincola]MBT0773537.1 IclR family transcriptional regulator [Kineosporia corallincola]